MRYYDFALNTSTSQIEKNTKIRLRDYGYDNTAQAVNNYFYHTLNNGVFFLIYRVEDKTFHSILAFDEKKYSFDEAYEQVLSGLKDTFGVHKIKNEPEEISMFQTNDFVLEAKRRELCSISRFVDNINLFIYTYDQKYTRGGFDFDERIVPDKSDNCLGIYDKSFITEIERIRSHENDSDLNGNIVHYIISSRSNDTAIEMTETLVDNLYKAKRLGSRRIELIRQMDFNFVNSASNYLEDIIENNRGGTIVIDLTEKFGKNPVYYGDISKLLLKTLKKHRNDCLFVFTYNLDNPGFAYQVLPEIGKYVIPVTLKEGKGDCKKALNYLKALIKQSEYSKYANQAGEFMKLHNEDEFTQTEILNLFEQFGPWCMNRNIFKSYTLDSLNPFVLDREEDDNSYDKLQKLIGLDTVKKQIDIILAADAMEKERKKLQGNEYQAQTMHMVFAGNPGTAKTTVAKLFAGIARERGILKSGAFVSVGGQDLDWFNCVNKIRDAFSSAKGGVLFIDEAYAIKSDDAATTLIQEMENHREDVIVIAAGYSERMKSFMELNEGMKSRIPFWVEFPDYTTKELLEIFKTMLEDRKMKISDEGLKEAGYILDKERYNSNFGNGRFVRNLIDRSLQNQAVRLYDKKTRTFTGSKKKLNLLSKEDICMLNEGLQTKRPEGSARKELEKMIGLKSVKDRIDKIVAFNKYYKRRLEKGAVIERPCMHMVFSGSPGTAKSTVARLFGEIMNDEKILPSGNFVEVSRKDLISCFVGGTASLVKKKFEEARGGILFIDEAYSLIDNTQNSYGDEAINTIVQEMENRRENTVVIFAGYSDRMKEFIERNPGMKSRISFQIEFEDYTTDELCEIAKLMVAKKNQVITEKALQKLRRNIEAVKTQKDFGNGRYVRKCLEEAEMNLASRLMEYKDSRISDEMMNTIEETDIPDITETAVDEAKQIGFAC